MSDLNNLIKLIYYHYNVHVIKKLWNLHSSLHGSLVRHQDMNPRENQRSVVQGSQSTHGDKKNRGWHVGRAGLIERE